VIVDCTKRGLRGSCRRGWRTVGGRGIAGFERIVAVFGRLVDWVGRFVGWFGLGFARGSRTVGRRAGVVAAWRAGFGVVSSMGLGLVAAALSTGSTLVVAVEADAVGMVVAGRTVVDLVAAGMLVVVQAVEFAVAGTRFVQMDLSSLNCQAQRSDSARISKMDYLDSKEMTSIDIVVAVRRRSCIAQVSAALVEV
jgi:hypothetical protein